MANIDPFRFIADVTRGVYGPYTQGTANAGFNPEMEGGFQDIYRLLAAAQGGGGQMPMQPPIQTQTAGAGGYAPFGMANYAAPAANFSPRLWAPGGIGLPYQFGQSFQAPANQYTQGMLSSYAPLAFRRWGQ